MMSHFPAIVSFVILCSHCYIVRKFSVYVKCRQSGDIFVFSRIMFRHGAVKHVIFETPTLAILNKWHVRIQRGGRESGPPTPSKTTKI